MKFNKTNIKKIMENNNFEVLKIYKTTNVSYKVIFTSNDNVHIIQCIIITEYNFKRLLENKKFSYVTELMGIEKEFTTLITL